jgi:hypothetical protein
MKNPAEAVLSLTNVLSGYNSAKTQAGRKIVDAGITTVFAGVSSYLMNTPPHKKSICHTYLIEDILERQNCAGDEETSTASSGGVYWERDHFAEEFAGLLSLICLDLIHRYGYIEGRVRACAIDQVLEEWFETNSTVESFMAGRLEVGCLDEKQQKILEPLLAIHDEELCKTYRHLVDEKWLDVLLVVITDADQENIIKIKPTILNLTLRLQLSEDYANLRRDNRVSKSTLLTSATSKESRTPKRIQELLAFFKLASPYITNLGLGLFLGMAAKSALVARSLLSRYKAKIRNDHHWRDKEFFDTCNDFEKKLNTKGLAQLTL